MTELPVNLFEIILYSRFVSRKKGTKATENKYLLSGHGTLDAKVCLKAKVEALSV